ncbi:unnamed protein product [Ectocarpus sp. CCAP 1310/34]|nr:unnamed protein product [Ectocarpus sp. CCAP 1310/34]
MASFVSMTADCGPIAEEQVRHMPAPFGTGTGGYQAREDARGKPDKQRTNGKRHKCVTHNGQQNQRARIVYKI